jgi:Tol biopolymer transport system component
LERPRAERGAFLAAACGDDDALRQDVESLLAYDAASAPFLEQPAAVVLAAGIAHAEVVNRQLGPYTILSPLGAGGMGEVYRARDTKLGRDVAIKILPSHFTSDPERRARFAREARLLATLNHPHIGAIYGLEESDGITALVLELVEGETLADRLTRGPLPLSDALPIACQIADALDAAHQKGIVHRDLKPGNIVLQGSSGSQRVCAKVLDFGLAKAIAPDVADGRTRHASSSFDGTADGRILGTPGYMSPEQARGLSIDRRTDIWAFGCVLFEMLSGHRPFEGETATDTVARILEREPDWTVLPGDTPAAIRTLLRRCLRKEPHKRLHDIADARIEIDEIELGRDSGADRAIRAASLSRGGRARLSWMIAALVLVAGLTGVGGFLLRGRSEPAAGPYIEFPYQIDQDALPSGRFFNFALSPDGRHLAFIALVEQRHMVWLRPLDTIEARPIPGTEGATYVFWKPDSRGIGFFAGDRLKTIQLSGGAAADLSGVQRNSPVAGASWNDDDVIVFRSEAGALEKVSAQGGAVTAVTRLEQGDRSHAWPSFLADGQHFVYLALREREGHQLRVGSLDSSAAVQLGPVESSAIYASGHLLFQTAGRLVAQRFDLSTGLLGEPIALVRGDVRSRESERQNPAPYFSVSKTGLLAYFSGSSATQLTWLDRAGEPLGTVGQAGAYLNLDLSPNEERLAVSAPSPDVRGIDIWVVNLARGDRTRLTTDPSQEFDPSWSPDGTQIAFYSFRTEPYGIFRRQADGTGEDKRLADAVGTSDWSPDGTLLLYNRAGDLWLCPSSGNGRPYRFFQTDGFTESQGAFSPDGRWIAYRSNGSGRDEIYVRPFPSGSVEYKISRDGGHAPRWNGDGTEIYFLSPDSAMMVASIGKGMDFARTLPRRLFPTSLSTISNNPYAVTKDGRRFLMPVPVDPRNMFRITVAVNWTSRLPK